MLTTKREGKWASVGGSVVLVALVGCSSPASDSGTSDDDLRGCHYDAGGVVDAARADAGTGTGAADSGSADGGGGGGSDAATSNGAWPGATNTGVPAGVTLTAYTGPMIITTNGTVIDGKSITGDLRIKAANVIVKNCKIFGDVNVDPNDTGFSVTVQDTEIDAGRALGQDAYDGTGIGARDFVALRVNVHGGKRSINCFIDCTVKDSWLHGQATDLTGVEHESAIRMGSGSTIVHNTILCEAPNVAPDAGCSADLTGYGDFAIVQNNLIENNFFRASPSAGFCAYGGSTKSKPYSAGVNGIRFLDNVFERGHQLSDHGLYVCGYYGSITDYDTSAPGNQWTNNTYDDGTPVIP